ncbi:MAG: extracellular solute-binding protein [Oscillospiraceae bacterium]|jgi:ABC-type glycerol-3-phosphate transport system substrate-binding protein|nr:extracellular solute-binding protein [Oscillospiraceae bacterium]
MKYLNLKVKFNKCFLLIIIIIILLFITACKNDDSGNSNESTDSKNEGEIIHTVFDAYLYTPEIMYTTYIADLIHTTTIHEGLIYFAYVINDYDELTPLTIVVESMLSDGTQVTRVEIPIYYDDVSIVTLNITDQNHIALIITGVKLVDTEFESTIYYLEYTLFGAEIKQSNLTNIISRSINRFPILNALITQDKNIVLLIMEDGKGNVYLIDERNTLVGQMEITSGWSITQLKDGRVVISDVERNIDATRTVLREVDFSTGDWSNTYTVSVESIRNLYPAQSCEDYDLFVDDGIYLYGYNITTGDKTIIFNWLEKRIDFGFRFYLNFIEAGRFSLLISHGDFTDDTWRTEYIVLTQTERKNLQEYEIITLGGVGIKQNLHLQDRINVFNRQNQKYMIQLIDYNDLYDGLGDNLSDFRILIDLMTGNAPDITIGNLSGFTAMAKRGLLLDLYPFIDDDPEISRADFFSNILKAIESPDGSLPAISNNFTIETMIGMAKVTEEIQSWTFADLFALVERPENSDLDFVLGQWMTAERFLDTALSVSSQDFINWHDNIANLNSDEFIKLLEVSSRLPNELAPWDRDTFISPVTRMLRGEQLLAVANLGDFSYYQMYSEMLGDDFTAIGFPTEGGRIHLLNMYGYAISANSKHQDAAWQFIRQFFLPDINSNEYWNFPLRQDLFEELVAEAYTKTPIINLDANGNEVEFWPEQRGQHDFMVEIKALTEAEERGIRNILESEFILGFFDDTLTDIMREETPRFFAGDRSAADTARVLQNRVQTYLNER